MAVEIRHHALMTWQMIFPFNAPILRVETMTKFVAVIILCLSLISFSTHADNAKADDSAERLTLSKELHDIRHIRDSIQRDIEAYAKRVPAADREDFMRYVALKIDFNALEQKSIQYAADVYTAPELRAMIAYYGSADGQSAELKGSVYGSKIAKDIRREIDAAIMAAKLGPAPTQK